MRGPVKESKVPKPSSTRGKRRKTNTDPAHQDSPADADGDGDEERMLMDLYDGNKDQGLAIGAGEGSGSNIHENDDFVPVPGQVSDGRTGGSPSMLHQHDSHAEDQRKGDENLDPQILADETPSMLHTEDVDHQFDEHLARLASDGQLAEALLRLPQERTEEGTSNGASGTGHRGGMHQGIGVGVGVGSGGGSGGANGNGNGNANTNNGNGNTNGHNNGNGNIDMGQDDEVEENLREAVLRMARAERADWDSMVHQ